jgi:hypothetical protein
MKSHQHPLPQCITPPPQPLDKLERVELRKEAAKFVEPGFKLVMQEKVRRGRGGWRRGGAGVRRAGGD